MSPSGDARRTRFFTAFTPFLPSVPRFFVAQLHHLPPNAISYLAAFVSLCENFIGCPPHWGLFKHLFTCRAIIVKKATPRGENPCEPAMRGLTYPA